MRVGDRVTMILGAGLLVQAGCGVDTGSRDEPTAGAGGAEDVAEARQALCAHPKCEVGAALGQTCGDPCVAEICEWDPYCCETAWDGVCVMEVSSVCGQSCTCSHGVCQTGAKLGASCNECTAAVCAHLPECCTGAWSSACVAAVETTCSGAWSCSHVGDLYYEGCDGAVATCTNVLPAMPFLKAISVSPDDQSVYAVGDNHPYASLSHFRRASNGDLTFAGVLTYNTTTGGPPLMGVTDLVSLSSSVYTVTDGGNIAHFQRAMNGDLTYVGCVGGSSGCSGPGLPATYLDPRLAVSPDGASLYATVTTGRGGVYHFRRKQDGTLSYAGCIGDNVPGCTQIGVINTMKSPTGLAVTGDGAGVYVLSSDPGAVAWLRRSPKGDLTFVGCSGPHPPGVPPSGCALLGKPEGSLYGAGALVISPDLANVYVAGGGRIATFSRNLTQGTLGYVDCLGADDRCSAPVPAGLLDYRSKAAITNDGASVYVASPRSPGGSVIHFRRGPGGALAYAGCIGGDIAECTPIPPDVNDQYTAAIVVANGNESVYTASTRAPWFWQPGFVSHFRRVVR